MKYQIASISLLAGVLSGQASIDAPTEDYNKLQVGFIAQEVKAVNDELDAENNIVSIDEDGFHRMDYEKIIVPLVKAMQEQQAQIDDLRNQVRVLIAIQSKDVNLTGSSEGDQ